MYEVYTLCTFPVCTKKWFLVCTYVYITSKCLFLKLHSYLYYIIFCLITFLPLLFLRLELNFLKYMLKIKTYTYRSGKQHRTTHK